MVLDLATDTTVTDCVAVELPVEPQSAAGARALISSLQPDSDDSSPDDVRLLVSELIADGVAAEARSAEPVITVEAQALDGATRVMVAFEGLALRLAPDKPEPAESGWGVYLVRTLANRWGIQRANGSTYVWFQA